MIELIELIMTAGREVLWSIWAYAFSTPERATATFTGVLAISTIGLWWSTRKLWGVTRIAAEHIPRVERAYVSGGAQWTSADAYQLRVMINNYGKTPAFIGTVIIHTHEADGPLPQKPMYVDKGEFVGYVLKPDTPAFPSSYLCLSFGRTLGLRADLLSRHFQQVPFQRLCVESFEWNACGASTRCLLGGSRRTRPWSSSAPVLLN